MHSENDIQVNMHSYTILIIDDNPSNLRLLRELLTSHGYHVRVADSPITGLESAMTSPPDLILLDIKMPIMDGYSVCIELRKHQETSFIPVIFISASASGLNKIRAFEVGGMDYISKPFDAPEVLARIQNHIQLSTLQKQAESSQTTNQHMLSAIMNNSPASISIKGLDDNYLIANRAFEGLMSIGVDALLGKTDHDVFSPKISDTLAKYDREILNGDLHKQYEATMDLKGGKQTFIILKFPLKDSSEHIYAICSILTDISMRKRAEAELEHLATTDTLTGLSNRSVFMELLSRSLAAAERDHTKHAVLYIDLDNFKNINDSMGHHIGDLLLREVGYRLKACTRGEDTVSRLGGDEFVLLMHRIKGHSDAVEVSSKIIKMLAKPFEIKEHTVFITASIGIVISPENGDNALTLIRNADIAMYQSKSKGRNTYQFFTEEINQQLLERTHVEEQLRSALGEGAITPFYQPKVNTLNGEIIGIEALARWNDPELGEISPATFIPVAEELNLIMALDRQALKKTIELFAPLINKGIYSGTVSVNLSAHHFYRNHLLDYIDQLLKDNQFPAKYLDLEITERTVMKNTDEAIKLMHKFDKSGIQLSIDDFGIGYSSLSYLKQFPVETLKIDVSFIQDINNSKTDRNIVASIINLAHGLNLRCVAEGVETVEQAKALLQINCDVLQGFLFSPAVEFEIIKDMLERKHLFTHYLE